MGVVSAKLGVVNQTCGPPLPRKKSCMKPCILKWSACLAWISLLDYHLHTHHHWATDCTSTWFLARLVFLIIYIESHCIIMQVYMYLPTQPTWTTLQHVFVVFLGSLFKSRCRFNFHQTWRENLIPTKAHHDRPGKNITTTGHTPYIAS